MALITVVTKFLISVGKNVAYHLTEMKTCPPQSFIKETKSNNFELNKIINIGQPINFASCHVSFSNKLVKNFLNICIKNQWACKLSK